MQYFSTRGAAMATLLGATALAAQSPTGSPSIAPYISPAFPQDLVAARRADRIAWLAYDRGLRNAYAAAAPDFRPVQARLLPNRERRRDPFVNFPGWLSSSGRALAL